MKTFSFRHHRLALIALVWLTVIAPARAQIRSYTLGLDVNCPYGLTECWTLIREGLEAIDGVAGISPRADAVRGTCEMRPRNDDLVNPEKLSVAVVAMGVGARLRGLEITAEGALERRDSQIFLRIDGVKNPLPLAPLREKLQMNNPRKRREEISEPERTAHEKLSTQAASTTTAAPRVRLTGPLTKATATAELVLEVRTFEFLPATTTVANKP